MCAKNACKRSNWPHVHERRSRHRCSRVRAATAAAEAHGQREQRASVRSLSLRRRRVELMKTDNNRQCVSSVRCCKGHTRARARRITATDALQRAASAAAHGPRRGAIHAAGDAFCIASGRLRHRSSRVRGRAAHHLRPIGVADLAVAVLRAAASALQQDALLQLFLHIMATGHTEQPAARAFLAARIMRSSLATLTVAEPSALSSEQAAESGAASGAARSFSARRMNSQVDGLPASAVSKRLAPRGMLALRLTRGRGA